MDVALSCVQRAGDLVLRAITCNMRGFTEEDGGASKPHHTLAQPSFLCEWTVVSYVTSPCRAADVVNLKDLVAGYLNLGLRALSYGPAALHVEEHRAHPASDARIDVLGVLLALHRRHRGPDRLGLDRDVHHHTVKLAHGPNDAVRHALLHEFDLILELVHDVRLVHLHDDVSNADHDRRHDGC